MTSYAIRLQRSLLLVVRMYCVAICHKLYTCLFQVDLVVVTLSQGYLLL